MLRVVIDTNVFVSGLLNSPSCRKVIELLKDPEISLIVSPPILNELTGVISRPKFKKIITTENIEKLIETIRAQAILVKPVKRLNTIKEDPADNRFLEASIEGKADFIISGDQHLLGLKSHKTTRIVTPKEFLKMTGLD